MADDRSSRQMKRLKRDQRAKRLPCWLCGQPVNYEAEDPHADDAFSYDHAKSWRDYPHLRFDPGNGRTAHQLCNKSRGVRDPRPSLGLLSRII